MIRLLLVVGTQLVELLEVALRGKLGDVWRIHGGDTALMLCSHGGRWRWRWRWRPEERVTRSDSLRETSGRAGQLGGLETLYYWAQGESSGPNMAGNGMATPVGRERARRGEERGSSGSAVTAHDASVVLSRLVSSRAGPGRVERSATVFLRL